jgi:hypothetical protein
MKKLRMLGLGVVGVSALALLQAVPANAEGVGQSNDIVGVGSDTTFVGMNFLADGDNLGSLGFNAGSLQRRMISMDPTGDANGRLTPNGTVVLRAGRSPVTRPNGTGAGINFVNNNDRTAPHQVNFMRASAMPTAAQQQAAVNNGWGGIHCYQFATDGLAMAVSNATPSNAGTSGLSIQTLVQLYSATGTVRNWGDIPGYNGPAAGTAIEPLLIQSGSGTQNFFIAQLTAANGGTPITFRSGLTVVEEHDPTPIQNNANAIAPFSSARKTLLDSGYFGAALQNTIGLQRPPTNPNAFSVTRPVFVLVRQSSVTDHTGADGIAFPWRGSGAAAQNWVEALFGPAGTPAGSPGGFMARASLARPLVEAAGFTYQYADLGLCQQ